MIRYAVLSSGSAGNSTLVCSDKTQILIDCGINKKTLCARLGMVDSSIEEVDRLLITHSHSDHISGVRFIPTEKWMSSSHVADAALKDMKDEKKTLDDSQYFFPYQEFKIGSLSITPLPLSHDAPNTVGFLFKDKDESLVYITDTGYIKDKVMNLIGNADYYIFESNHDTKMLYESDRSVYLIRRIHSDIGHLDNVASATYLSSLLGKKTKEVTLAHLSEECNKPEIALETFNTVMLAQLGYVPDVLLRCASIENILTGGHWEKKL
jgi:phosphoribosyl 1,2-cyclic phosphodiesterase